MVSYYIQFSQRFDNLITSLAYDEGVDKNEIFRTAFTVYEYLKKKTRKTGTKLALIDSDGKIIETFVMPWENRNG